VTYSELVFFVSYERFDAQYEPDRQKLRQFVADLEARVAVKLARTCEGISFFDEASLESGERWEPGLVEALRTAPVGVALYSPLYFTRRWCGTEFQVFLNRISKAIAPGDPSGVVPVLWEKCTTFPPSTKGFQRADAGFPSAYSEVGLRQLLALQKIYADDYTQALEAIADGIVAASQRGRLAPMPTLNIDDVPSAWELSASEDANSHKKGSIAKTCFVFVSQKGWDWQPYPERGTSVGAMAQQISGGLGLRTRKSSATPSCRLN
jgi:TIR domain